MHDTDKEWEKIGQTEPYFGVLTDDRFLYSQFDEKASKQFWASGERHVENIFKSIADHIQPDFIPKRALDFGCGVGRITLPLSGRCKHVTGMDVSASMLEIARQRLAYQNVQNATFRISSNDLASDNEQFDFIHSYIVFQHIRVKRGYRILDRLLERLTPGGVCVLHFTFHNYQRNRWLRFLHRTPVGKYLGNLLLSRPLNSPVMLMNEYDLNQIMARVRKVSNGRVFSEFTDHGVAGVVLYFQKDK